MNFKKVMEVLPASDFCRVHNSYIIALNRIDSIEKGGVKINNTFIPISRSNKDEFLQLIDRRLL